MPENFHSSRSLSILLAPFGSEGDVRPLLWLGDGLAARGHRITLALTPFYKKFADARPGWRFLPFGTAEEFEAVTRDPRLWQPRKGSLLVLSMMLDSLTDYRDLLDGAGERFDAVIGTTLSAGALTWAEARGIPTIKAHLQPLCFRSANDCPLMGEGWEWLCSAPPWVKRALYWLMDKSFARFLVFPKLNQYRAGLGLRPLSRVTEEVWHGGNRVAGLFPPWYCAPQPDWPQNARLFGFPLSPPAPGAPAAKLSDELESFLAAGEPPVLWTHGSANLETDTFAAGAIGASRRLGARCLLVCRQPPREMPPASRDFLHVAHAPFDALFPRCRAVVHHGGIGTSVAAMAAGVPQLVVPRAHDQPDNARRLERLGVGARLSYRKYSAATAVAKLRALLDAPGTPAACSALREKLLADNLLPDLCAWVEELNTRKIRPSDAE